MLKSVKYRLSNLQKGFSLISYRGFQKKVTAYTEKYKMHLPMNIETNVNVKSDITLFSVCVDKVIEDYLHSNAYTMDRIGIILNPFRYAPKTAVLLLYSSNPVRVKIRMRSADKGIEYEDTSSLKQYHRISVTGLGNGINRISLSFYDENDNEIKQVEGKFNLANIKQLEQSPIVKKNISEASSYKNIIITGGTLDPVVFNTKGDIFHYFDFRNRHTSQYGIYMINKGKFLWPVRHVGVPTYTNPYSCLIYEMDFMGRISRTFHVNKGIHHAACELPNGNLVSISSSLENHTADVFVEIERTTGKIVRTIDLKDIFGEKYRNQIDWIHPNSLEYDAEEDTMLFCMRNIHTIAKINWTTLEVIWILSLPSLWTDTEYTDKVLQPKGDVHYSFQAHAAYEIKELRDRVNGRRSYMVFNNNRLNRRPIHGYVDDGYSYIIIYEVDEKEKKVCQIKDLRIDKSVVRSNARYDVENGRIYNMSGCLTADCVDVRGQIEEYDYETEQLINSWSISKDFYSAYEFTWKSDDYCDPILLNSDYRYVCGETDTLSIVDDDWVETVGKVDEICYSNAYVEETNFYFKTKDHSISALLLVGANHTYQRDYTDTYQSLELHADRNYYCVVSLLGLEDDLYHIKILKDNKVYETGDYIRIHNQT